MSKKYILGFRYKDLSDSARDILSTGKEILLDYDTYDEALKEAKFYFSVFFGVIWNNANVGNALNLSFEQLLDETLKVADSFKIVPNESNFDFIEYAKYLDKLYRFELEMAGIWKGHLPEYELSLGKLKS